MKRLFLAIATTAIFALCVSAQKIGTTAPTMSAKQPKVAFLPLMFQEGDRESDNKTAIAAYESSLFDAFSKLGMERLGPVVNFAWRELKGSIFSTTAFELPDPANLVKLGQKVGADYVVVSRCKWNVRSVWVGVGPKTKATAKVDIWIVDISKSEFALKADGIESDSTEKEPGWKTAVTIIILPISVVSGGPKTPHLVRSGQLSVAKGIKPWLEKMQTPSKIRIGGG
ncbi:MAG: hypothetical protein AAB613_01845 [Patescibacteria group bacterium]